MLKPEVTVNPTGDEGHWGLEKANRMTDGLVTRIDRRREEREERKSRRRAPG